MENRQQQILAEIQSMMASIRNELNMLDVKISEFQQIAAGAGNEPEPIDLEPIEFTMEASEIEVVQPELEVEVEPEVEIEPEVEAEPEMEVETEVKPEMEPVVEEVESAPEVVVEEVVEDLPVEEDDDLPFFEDESVFAEPEPVKVEPVKEEPVAVKEEPAALIDAMLDKLAWRRDMPGSAVKDVRSAISLNDRILFINKLFAEDPMAFQAAVGKLNAMESLDEVVAYVKAEHSNWNLESDVVYRFMMAVRRKVR
ncbi:MAG: hypothetical protein IKW11_08250 [Bacteroidales bacterium]|nr:hypothetical protein [Bacteroidales bacterium]